MLGDIHLRNFPHCRPSILVSDILWQYDACESPSVPYQLLRRDDACTVLKINLACSPNIVDREAAYLAARERIFGMDKGEPKETERQRPRNVPVVARRMIAHALGQRINHSDQAAQGYEAGHSNGAATVDDIERSIEINLDLHLKNSTDSNVSMVNSVKCCTTEVKDAHDCSRAVQNATLSSNPVGVGLKPSGKNGVVTSKMSMREENFGAAKRMFAHALGIPASKDGIPKGK